MQLNFLLKKVMHQPKKIFVMATEPSGDHLGGALVHALIQKKPHWIFSGIGGPEMTHEGRFTSLCPFEKMGIMGFGAVLRNINFLRKALRETHDAIHHFQPDLILGIDSPDFCLRILKNTTSSAKRVQCVAPSVWASRPGRAQKIAQFLHHLMVLFPFEPPYFERYNLPTTFIGHPIAQRPKGQKARFHHTHNLAPNTPLICCLPGSRHQEIYTFLPIFLQALKRVRRVCSHACVVLPTLPHLKSLVQEIVAQHMPDILIIENRTQYFDALDASTCAIATSGTVALDLAYANVPGVIAYRVTPLVAFFLKYMIQTPFISLVNVLMQEMIMPERLQSECAPEVLAQDIFNLLENEQQRQRQKKAFKIVTDLLHSPMGSYAETASSCIIDILMQ